MHRHTATAVRAGAKMSPHDIKIKLPRPIARELQIQHGDKLLIYTDRGRIIIEKVKQNE
jgi:anaerobic selenocysteine-containing dehydrogenase